MRKFVLMHKGNITTIREEVDDSVISLGIGRIVPITGFTVKH